MFALISASKKPDSDEFEETRPAPDYRFYDLKDAFGTEKRSLVDFQKLFVVNLAALDLAVFNPDGAVQLRRDQPDPSIVLSKGWNLVFKGAKRLIFPKNKPPSPASFGIGKRAAKLAATISGDLVRYPLRRIGRLQPATATAVLAAWATFQTRAAFDHDFAKEKDSKPSASDQQPSARLTPVDPLPGADADVPVGPHIDAAAAVTPEPASTGRTAPAKVVASELPAQAKVEPPKLTTKPEADSGATASPPSA
jgi:hypothetical protein